MSKEKKEHKNIYEALSAFQGEMKTIDKSKEVEFKTSNNRVISYKYAPLDKIIEEVTPVLAKHGLSIRHEIIEGGTKVEAILTHETYNRELEVTSTETTKPRSEEENEIVLEARSQVIKNELRSGGIKINQNQKMKDVAGEITYAKRYTLSMLLGIATEEDKDSKNIEEESAEKAKAFTFSRVKKSIKECKNKEELDRKKKMITGDLEKLKNKKTPSLGLNKEQYNKIIGEINEKENELKKAEEDKKKKEKSKPKDTEPEEKEEEKEKEEAKKKGEASAHQNGKSKKE